VLKNALKKRKVTVIPINQLLQITSQDNVAVALTNLPMAGMVKHPNAAGVPWL
jgi:hypothetical protein